jgi:sialate O-acetylesterase
MRFPIGRWTVALSISLLAASFAQAEVTLHRLFSDNGILQRGMKVPVWGATDKPDAVTVKFGGQSVTATPENGKWKVALAPMESSATPRDLTVQQGDQTITRKNIVVGDIWLCGGQSNMEWPVKRCAGKEEAISSSTNPDIRLFTVKRHWLPQPQTELDGGSWAEANPQTVPDFSAVGYYFGRDLQKQLHVPIGLISSNVGGTTAERWMSKEAIDGNPELKDITAPQGRSDLYNAMIAPLAPCAIKGAIWYQGEGNADRPYHYRHVLSAVINDWRATFGQPELPFFIVELAPYMKIVDEPTDQTWSTVRESMQWIANHLPMVDTVSIVDVGDEKDIHPKQKQPVGARLAIAARAHVYGEKITPAGPEFESVSFLGNQAIVKLKNVGSGLEARDGELKGFTLAGDDKKFHKASARIEGDTVVVTCDAVPAPKAVRFGWANYPVVNLWNKDGLPASTLRSDDWEVAGQSAK